MCDMQCRYCRKVDEYWHVPHFEKMVYDNPQLALTYLAALQLTGGCWGYLRLTLWDRAG